MADKQRLDPERYLSKLNVNSKDISRRLKKAEGATVKHARRFVFRRLDNFREVRRHIAIWVLTIGVIIGATGLQFLWYQQGYRTTTGATGGTYAEAVVGPVNSLNPLFASTSAEESASELLFSRLLRYDSDGTLNYDLAESMTVSKDQRTYTVTMRSDARWHDGLYVRARDVLFTINLVKNTATRSTISGWGGVKVTEVDSRTVAFELPSVYAPFPHALEQLPILPEHILRDVEPSALLENGFSRKPIGSGPFAIRAVQDLETASGSKVVHLTRNNDYYRGAAKLDRVQLHVYKDSDAVRRALEQGEVNAASDLLLSDSRQVNQKRYTVESRPVNTGVYALFNTTSPLLKDASIRRALQTGTDTSKVRENVASDLLALDMPFIPRQVAGKQPALPAYDVVAAGALLDAAGWHLDGGVRKKNGEPLQLSVVTMKNADFEKALTELATQWRALGVTVTTRIVDPSDPLQNVAQDILQPRQYDVLLYSLTIGGDPDVYVYWHSSQASSGYNFTNYRNSIVDDALVSARSRLEPELRDAKYLTFARQWVSDAPAIGLYQAIAPYVHTKGVQATRAGVTLVAPTDRFGDVTNWTVGERRVYTTP